MRWRTAEFLRNVLLFTSQCDQQQNSFCIYSLSCLNPLTIINIVTNSAAGKASHTPVMPKAAESANAKMLIAIKPRMIDAANAYFTDSTALRIAEPTILIPAKIKPVK